VRGRRRNAGWFPTGSPTGNRALAATISDQSGSIRRPRCRGEPTLRTADGEQQLREGDVVAFRRGKDGAHQVKNGTDAPIRVLMLSTLIAPDIVEYLDSGKVGARSVAGERIMFGRPGPELDYWEGED
jgi:uncharacterized cupin superfamily protein